MARFTLEPQGPFTLRTFAEFGCGLFAASRACAPGSQTLRLAFPADGTHAPVGVRLEPRGSRIEGEVFGTRDVDAVRTQVARMLSVEHDARPFAKLVGGHPALRAAYEANPGFRPPIFSSPYAAAGWFVLTQRMQQGQAARLQQALAREGGDLVVVDAVELTSFPRPETFLRRTGFPGIPGEKWGRLQAVARAALEGRLDVERLRAMSHPEAIAHLRKVEGVGPWTAAGIWMRALGLTDAFIVEEPQVHAAAALAYGLDRTPDDAQLAELAEAWRPYRAWVTVMLTMAWYRARAVAPEPRERGMVRGSRRPRNPGVTPTEGPATARDWRQRPLFATK